MAGQGDWLNIVFEWKWKIIHTDIATVKTGALESFTDIVTVNIRLGRYHP